MLDIPIPKLEGYVIYNPSNGLFSKGGSHQTEKIWGKKPKIWKAIGHVKNHLCQFHVGIDYYKRDDIIHIRPLYKGCKVLNIVDQTEPFDIFEYLLEVAMRDARGRRIVQD